MYTKTHKKQIIPAGFAGLFLILYGIVFFVPKPVNLSFSDKTCVDQITVLPKIHRGTSDEYDVSFEGTKKLGSVDVLSTSTCFMPTKAPEQGKQRVATSPWGGLIAKKFFNVAVAQTPSVNTVPLNKPIPTTKDVVLPISQPDTLYDYRLVVGDNSADCIGQDEPQLNCDIASLDLKQGRTFQYRLERRYKEGSAELLAKSDLSTLEAVDVVDGDITKEKTTLYSKSKNISLELDEPIKKANLIIKNGDGVLASKTEIDGSKVAVVLDDELDRDKAYKLQLSGVEAENNSTLVEDYIVDFKTSDGPLPSAISIKTSGVAQSERIILTFDQTIKSDANIAKHVGVTGGSASVQKIGDKQIAIQLQQLPLCGKFTVTVKKGIQSEHEVSASKDWSYGSRVTCYTTSAYGTSLQGRPLIAYNFGNSGATTMYVGAIHGNETSSRSMMLAWVNELEANPDKLNGRRVTIIPSINPDGVAANTRTNSRGVNLNRNFPTSNWKKDIIDTDGEHKGGGGESPLSEPEASALANFTRQVGPKLLVSYHAVGSLVMGDVGSISASYAQRYAGMVGYSNATGSSSTFNYEITGGYEEWAYQNIGIPSMVVELGSYGYYNFPHHRSAIWAMME